MYPFIPLIYHYLFSNFYQFPPFILSSFPEKRNFLFRTCHHLYWDFPKRISSLCLFSSQPVLAVAEVLVLVVWLWGIPCTSCVCDDKLFLWWVVLAMGVVSFRSSMGRSSIFKYATMSSSLAKAFTPKVAGWGIVELKLLEGSLLKVEAVGRIVTRGTGCEQPRRINLLGLLFPSPRRHLCGGLPRGGKRRDLPSLSRVPSHEEPTLGFTLSSPWLLTLTMAVVNSQEGSLWAGLPLVDMHAGNPATWHALGWGRGGVLCKLSESLPVQWELES